MELHASFVRFSSFVSFSIVKRDIVIKDTNSSCFFFFLDFAVHIDANDIQRAL